ncbi:MAG: hypothetical protein K2I10_08050 [Lachnospiraceae bacterium]|nr:hypothetical protein [Lachnospiraceae bacterium]
MYNIKNEMERTQMQLREVLTYNDKISNTKIIVSMVGVGLFFYNRKHDTVIGWCIFIGLCVLFVYLFLLNESRHKQIEHLEARSQILNRYHLRSIGEWKEFEDTGEEYLTENSYLEKDLDILGASSLFQYLCVANTVQGKRKLAEYLMQRKVDSRKNKERVSAVKELIDKFEFRLRLETWGYLSKEKKRHKNDEWYYNFINDLETDDGVERGLFYNVLGFFPLVGVFVFLFVYQTHSNHALVFIILFLEMIISYYISYKNRMCIDRMEQFCMGLENMVGMAECIATEPFQSKMLKDMQSEINSNADLISGIHKLSKIKEAFSVRRNLYIHVFLQMFLMYDLQCINQLEKWKKVYGKNFQKLFNVIGEVEALLSLGVMALNREVTFADVSESCTPVFFAREIYHPLIDPEKVVSNSINVSKGINIITGSNMSGKSTFMRTVGINMVLAYAGSPVCAKEMSVSLMELYTCMRVSDDVFQGRSSFYAEVLRIKTIIDASKGITPIFVIIDEIFKGTNSIDRITGAKEIIKHLNKPQVMLWVSTHDLEICSLIEENEVSGNNYHFLETYKDNKIIFDYKIKKGKCKSRNAKYILKMAGLLD